MRSLTLKLTLAFVLVGVIGAGLVAVITGLRTRSEFDDFVSNRAENALFSALAAHYAAQGSWAGVDEVLKHQPRLLGEARGFTLLDVAGEVVCSRSRYAVGEVLPNPLWRTATPVAVDAVTVGWVLFERPTPANWFDNRPSPEQDFLQRTAWAAVIGAGVAALLALALGGFLARTLAQPIRELTVATRAMASGQLDQRVAVRSRDEVGELAHAFNQMSADLAQASQLRKQMTADLAHDLRTPLSILRGYTEGLRDGRLPGSPATFALMHGEVEHLQRLVEDLRLLSLADAGELSLNRRAIDPAALLERAGLAYLMQAQQRGLTLRVEAAEDLPSVWVDTDRMAQVLNNLVGNALRHTQKGEIALTAQVVNDQQVALQVRDTGSGIAPADLPLVFDRFYRADQARQRAEDNTASGLGLAIAKAIVEVHGGTITVASTVGQGTTFTVTLPRSGAGR